WVGLGMALKLEFGDAGLEIWRKSHDATVTPDVEVTKWQSFTTEATPGVQTLNSWFDRAHKRGWQGSVRKSAAGMFEGVAALAAMAGAKLSSGAVPMVGQNEAELTKIGQRVASEFMAVTDIPLKPWATDY